MAHIAIIEDEAEILEALRDSLTAKQFHVSLFASAEEFLATSGIAFDLVLLDLGLPKMSGEKLCLLIREKDPVKPIIVITALDKESAAVSAFAHGADDFVRKPFGLEELHARIQRLLGRRIMQQKICRFEGLEVVRTARTARFGDRNIDLTNKEFAILTMLIEHAGEVVERSKILNAIDDQGKITDGTLDSHISHLRKKLKIAGAEHLRISSTYGYGYKVEAVS